MSNSLPRTARCRRCFKCYEPTAGDDNYCPPCDSYLDAMAREDEAAWRAKQEAEQVEHVRSFGDHDAAVDAAWGAGR